jgi:uncharacterized repeat protein (TIGR01451 family)/fimbrial isopeptide formation D2 family protein
LFFQKNYIVRFKKRNVFIYLAVISLFQFVLFSGHAFAALCGTPGKDGTGASGVVNTYYPGTASVSAGATSVPVGSSSGSSTAIAAGDLLLIIQMQDADINYTNTSSYGDGTAGGGYGYTAVNYTGLYEFAVAKSFSAGTVTIWEPLINSYRVRTASTTYGQSTFQVIRVPQYSSATASGVSAYNWDGSVGGIAVIDVAGTLTISGSGAINVNGAGFRGGFGRVLGGGAGANTDYVTLYTNNANGSKGEGIAGSPYYMNDASKTYDGAPNQATAGSGYPNGSATSASYARGAPGNAGGGGTDGTPADNQRNSGGGGGGNYGAGGLGGNSWNNNVTCGGVGGGAVGVSYARVVMGGGGGAATTNNGTSDNTCAYTNPLGLCCNAGTTGACSSGAPGGGIAILMANSITNAGTITANGGDGYNVANDGAGGGGAGGSVVIYSLAGGSATAYAKGGNGGNAWRTGGTTNADRHGPGGGGGGGYIVYNGFTPTTSVTEGICGKTTTLNDAYGALDGSAGFATSYASYPPGAPSGARCMLAPNLSTSTKTVVDLTTSPGYYAGDKLEYTITIKESAGYAATVSVTDTLDAYLDRTNANVTITTNPGCTYSNPVLSCAALSIPANGSVTIVYTAYILGSDAPGTTINNTATIRPTFGWVATPVAPVVTIAGTTTGTGNKPLYIWRDTATTGHLYRLSQAVGANYVTIAKGSTTVTFTLSPVLASNVTLIGGAGVNIPVELMLATNSARTYTIPITLRCGATTVASETTQTAALTGTITHFTFTLPLTSNYTCPAGSAFALDITNTMTGGVGARDVQVYPSPSAGNYSYVNLNSQSVINVNSIRFYDNTAYPGGTLLTTVTPGSTIRIRAVVSDPFGSYDIVTPPTIIIKNPSGSPVTPPGPTGASMSLVYTDPGSPSLTKTYEYQYTVPSSPTGNWSILVTASEGPGSEPTTTVTNTAYATMPVVSAVAVLSVVKTAVPSPSVTPGQVITYSMLVTNTTAGTATSVTINDTLSPYIQWGVDSYGLGVGFQFVDSVSNPSGLTMGTATFNNGTYTPTPGSGYDGNVNNFKLNMNGTMNGSGANFTINYKVRVK